MYIFLYFIHPICFFLIFYIKLFHFFPLCDIIEIVGIKGGFFMWQIWLIVAGICFIIEIITVGFLVFWLAIASLLTMIISFFTDNIILQTSVFVVSSAILIFATKPFVKKFVDRKNAVKTNVYSIIGKIGIVTQDIDSIHFLGQIKVEGETWSAVGLNDVNISQGTEVEVKEIKGVKAIVTPVQK